MKKQSFFTQLLTARTMKNKVLLIVLWGVLSAAAVSAQVSFGTPTLFDDGWLFSLADDSLAIESTYDDSLWRHISVPHDWSIEGVASPTLASGTGYMPAGVAWYRKHFRIDDSFARHYIYFEGVYNRSEVYLNGHLLGCRPNGYISFMYDLTPYLCEGENVLAIRVDHSRYADSRWYTGSGIYRDVWLVAANDVHIAQWGVAYKATKITDREATIAVDVAIDDHSATPRETRVVATLYAADGQQVAQSSARGKEQHATLSLRVPRPQRWSIDTPYLYTLQTDLFVGGQRVDGSTTTVGLRTLTFDANKGFALNGVWTKVKGVCLHHDAGVLGAAVPKDIWQRRLVALKEIGTNAIRMSHNPQAPVVYALCDSIGLLVMDEAADEWEFPKRKWIEGWNVGTPAYDGAYDFFEEWIEQDVADMVRRDRNHPCIFLWSIGNEVDYPNDPYSHPVLDSIAISQPMFGGYDPTAPDAARIGMIAARLAACVRQYDTSRPVTGALAGVAMSNYTIYPDVVDVVGYNYTESRYAEDHATYPNRVIYGSENGHSVEAWRAVADNDYIFGQFLWTGIDYLGESGQWPSRGKETGLLDYTAARKKTGWLRMTLWSDTPTTYVCASTPLPPRHRPGTNSEMMPPAPNPMMLAARATEAWNYDEGQQVNVFCFTNAPQARLLLNGVEVGALTPYDATTGVIMWNIPFAAGELIAEGCDEQGNVLSSYVLHTSARPYALCAESDVSTLTAEHPLAQVAVTVVDENGIPVCLADNMVTCIVDGPATLLGLENGDSREMTYRHGSPQRRVYEGRLMAYIQMDSTAQQGDKVKITLRSPLLQTTELSLSVK